MTNGSAMKRRHVAVLVLAMLCAWTTWRCSDLSLPPIARGLPAEFAKGDPVFKQRVAERYPLGSSEASMRRDLRLQGFAVKMSRRKGGRSSGTATVSRFNGCGTTDWVVRWRADPNDRLTEVFGLYGATCL